MPRWKMGEGYEQAGRSIIVKELKKDENEARR
jgi:hypothetical protein